MIVEHLVFYFDENPIVHSTNAHALGAGLELAERMMAAHLRALEELVTVDMTDSPALQVESALSYHAANLFAECMDLVIKGRFDTLLYLLRPMFDIGALLALARRSDEAAKRFLDDELKASAARSTVVQLLRDSGLEEDAAKLDEGWRETASQLQFSAHVTVRHMFGLLEDRPGGSVAIAGGRPDGNEARSKARFVIGAEMRVLVHLGSSHPDDLSPETQAMLHSIETAARQWLLDPAE